MNNTAPCLFCQNPSVFNKDLVREFKHCYVLRDQYPVTKGHLLIIPKEHIENWFKASPDMQKYLMDATNEMKEWLDKEYQPDGYNVGMNCGWVSGQTIMHLHIHLIPRYQGDVSNPRGGVRGVIPSKQSYG
jgi:diadenosine tetraphosphate (Ap4A) HIT family hydrolase